MQPEKLPRSTRVNGRGQPGATTGRPATFRRRTPRACPRGERRRAWAAHPRRAHRGGARTAPSCRRYTATPRVQPRGRRGHSESPRRRRGGGGALSTAPVCETCDGSDERPRTSTVHTHRPYDVTARDVLTSDVLTSDVLTSDVIRDTHEADAHI